MNHGVALFIGILVAVGSSWFGLISGPYSQLGQQQAAKVELLNLTYPVPRPGLAQKGAEVYQRNGCYYCHTQQVRHEGYGSDLERGWGERFSVARDYLYDQPVMLGNLRIGPDLANIGLRQTNEVRYLMHLYDPRTVEPNSTMPSYKFLFEKQRIKGRKSTDALPLPSEFAVEEGYQVVPKPEAEALVAYLMSLGTDVPLFEGPIPQEDMEESGPGMEPVAGQ